MRARVKNIILVFVAIYLLFGVLVAGRTWVRELGQFSCRDGELIVWASIRESNPDPARCARLGFMGVSLERIPYNILAWPFALATFREDPREAYAQGEISDAGYIVENGAVYREEVIQTASAEGRSVQVNDILLKDADPRTFMAVPVPRGVNAAAEADPHTMSFLAHEWGKDARNIFWEAQTVMPADPAVRIDLATFAPLSSEFIKDKDHVYVIVPKVAYQVLPNLDPATFVLLDGPYAKDANGVYSLDTLLTTYSALPIPNMDPATFRILGVCASFEKGTAYYTADANTVMAGNTVVPGADAKTFQLIATYGKNPDGMSMEGSYAVDKSHVYKDCGEIVQGADPAECIAGNLKGCEANRMLQLPNNSQ